MLESFVFVGEDERVNDFGIAREPGVVKPQAEDRQHQERRGSGNEFGAVVGFFGEDAFLMGVGGNVDALVFRLLAAINGANVAELFHAEETKRFAADYAGIDGGFLFMFGAELDA